MVRAAVGEKGVSAAAVAEILLATRAAGGVEQARRRAGELAREASAHLAALPPSPFRDALHDLAAFAADRMA
jgi:geranylgeranyl pyrophosphate synthase